MRSLEALVQELDREAPQFSMVAIVVAFDDTSQFVFHEDDHEKMLSTLRSLIAQGGQPCGLLGYTATEKGSTVASSVYDEVKDTVWATPLMEELAQNMVATLEGYEKRAGSA
jgi:hypothetical protein